MVFRSSTRDVECSAWEFKGMTKAPLLELVSLEKTDLLMDVSFKNATWTTQGDPIRGLVITEKYGLRITKEGDLIKIWRTCD